MKNKLVQKFGKEKRWVNYRIQTRKGKTTKLPYNIKGKLASSVNPADWSDYDTAKKHSPDVGIVFTPDENLLGIDIDHCLKNKKIDHEQKEKIADLILEADTYTEISPSGEGLHLFLALTEPLKLESNKKAPFELYTSGRYFTFTGNTYGKQKDVRSVSKEVALEILKVIGYPWKVEEKVVDTPHKANKSQENIFTLNDDEILKKLFNSKGGDKVKALYNGSLEFHNNDASSADMAFCSHLAFWTAKDAGQMERIWVASPLGQRKKTKEREDYRRRTINAAIKSCKTVYETPQAKMEKVSPNLGLLYTISYSGQIEYLQNTENMCRILRKHEDFAGCFRYDSFRNVMEIKVDGKWRALEDHDQVNVQTAISIIFTDWFGRVGKDMVYDAIIKVSKENEYDSAIQYVKSLVWDKVARLDNWLSKVYGAPEDTYHKAVASNWLKGMVKRIVHPGCKFDYVLVLEGEQGSRKSTSLAILGKDWHVETTMSTDNKDFFMQFQGKAIVEFSEGETMSRTEVKKMKAIITTQIDRYRTPYGKVSQDFPRRCVFAMTTNQTEYLKDETGNRRWLPVALAREYADTEWLEANRDQLLAEAYHRIEVLKETVYEFPREETIAAQQARRIKDPNNDLIVEWYFTKVNAVDKANGISIDRVYREVLCHNFVSKPISRFEQMSIASVLKDTLKLTKKDSWRNGVRASRWFNETSDPMDAVELSAIEQEVKDF